MKIGFIGDIVGRPGRQMVQTYLPQIKKEYSLDCVIANSENASAGFGITPKNMIELFESGIDIMTGGNHSWDKKEIIPLLQSHPILRPHNYPLNTPGRGYDIFEIGSQRLGVINVLGHFTMPMVENPYNTTIEVVETLLEKGLKNIFIDFHAEATSEKRALFLMLKEKISMLCGTHTHIGTDDLSIVDGAGYVTDVGLTGCRDNIIGMDSHAPIQRFRTGIPASNKVPKQCKKIFQMIIFELEDGKCKSAKKLKYFDDLTPRMSEAIIE